MRHIQSNKKLRRHTSLSFNIGVFGQVRLYILSLILLGLLLSDVYFSDKPNASKDFKYTSYADDVTLFSTLGVLVRTLLNIDNC